jgi:hypothetical protein
MLVPSGNGLYLLPRTHNDAGLPSRNVDSRSGRSVALAVECDPALWHSRLGHLNMQSLQAQHSNNTTSVPSMPSYVTDLSCESCNMNKATSAPRYRTASQKHAPPLEKFSCDLWGHVHVPSPYGLRYCLLVIDHHTNFKNIDSRQSLPCTRISIPKSARTDQITCPRLHCTCAV